MAIKAGEHTTAEAMAALSLTVEEVEEMERNSPNWRPMSKYGDLFCSFLKEHHPDRYDFLVSEMEIYDVCRAVDDEAREMMTTIQNQRRAPKATTWRRYAMRRQSVTRLKKLYLMKSCTK